MSDISQSLDNLTPEAKRHLLAAALRREAGRQRRPLSFSQQELWFHSPFAPQDASNHIQITVSILGEIELTLIEKSLNEIIQRHESLRTVFKSVGDQVFQEVAKSAALVALRVADLAQMSEPQRQAALQRVVDEDAQTPFDLAAGPLLRFSLVRLAPESYRGSLTVHHAVFDGWSVGVLLQELWAIYSALRQGRQLSLPAPSAQYCDYCRWQNQMLHGPARQNLLAYWRARLADLPRPLELCRGERAQPLASRRAEVPITLSSHVRDELKALNRREGVTLFMSLLAAFSVLLRRMTRQDDFLIGSPVACRNRADFQWVIGYIANNLLLRIDLSGNPTFRQLLEQVRKTVADGFDHQDLPYAKLVDELRLQRPVDRTGLFQVRFALQNYPLPNPNSNSNSKIPGLAVTFLNEDSGTSRYDLALEAFEKPDGLQLIFKFRTELFPLDGIRTIATDFQDLLGRLLADPDRAVKDVSSWLPNT